MQESVAVTQNYVSPANLPHVLKLLSSGSSELISGCPLKDRKTLHSRFIAALQAEKPQVVFFRREKRVANTPLNNPALTIERQAFF